ncbi:hypothetical protein K504DRAFT_495252 [Pleomassaria siparia CBS 279.74]|uniref:Mid2 domain-containing protein n=1 Tax=Pleomassaria siparia CBS 279.74 TaxID=1314801 RepID=A0A6G1JV76_9PLEO|nr:hypothetical protein K504DRAFT_495252 [Pleomassaria siparia CBS 279.74]
MNYSISNIVLIITLLLAHLHTVIACYTYSGELSYGQQVCPGTSQCCAKTATCTKNKLCIEPGQKAGTFVRGPCAASPWDPKLCAAICLYDEQFFGGVFPTVTICNDGSWCCNNDASCCDNKRGVFLDSFGRIVTNSSIPESSKIQTSWSTEVALSSPVLTATSSFPTLTPTSTSISTSISTSFSTSTIPAHTPAPTTSNPTTLPEAGKLTISVGVKVGLGVGVTLGVILIILLSFIAWALWKKQQNAGSRSAGTLPHASHEESHVNTGATPICQLDCKDGDRYNHSHELSAVNPQELESPTVLPTVGKGSIQ